MAIQQYFLGDATSLSDSKFSATSSITATSGSWEAYNMTVTGLSPSKSDVLLESGVTSPDGSYMTDHYRRTETYTSTIQRWADYGSKTAWNSSSSSLQFTIAQNKASIKSLTLNFQKDNSSSLSYVFLNGENVGTSVTDFNISLDLLNESVVTIPIQLYNAISCRKQQPCTYTASTTYEFYQTTNGVVVYSTPRNPDTSALDWTISPTTPPNISETFGGTGRITNVVLTVEYEDAPIKITSTLDKDTYAADTSFALNITNQDGENTVTTAKCTAEFLHTRGESVTSIQTLADFIPYSYAQLLPYDPNDNQNFVTRVQRLFEYIPDTWKTNTELLVFKPGDIYTIKLTVSEYTVDNVEYTDKPVEAIFEYTIGEGIDIQVSAPMMTSPTEANKNNISETASLTFSLPGQVGTYAVEKIEWMATLAGPNFTTTPLQLTQTGSNIPTETPPLGTATFEIPSEERAKITKNVEYTLTITAVATTVDGKSTDEQITTITGCIFKPADYTLNFTIPALQDKKKIYSGEEIALNFGLVKTANNEAINGLTYHLTISAGANTETYSVTNANTYAWRNSALPGAITYNFTCTTQYNSQNYTANITIGSADYPTYAKLISAKNLSFSDGGLLYYNTDTVPVTYELVIPNSATTEKFVITTSLDNTALVEQAIENNAKTFTISGTQNIPLTVDPYANYRGKVDIKLTATARENIDSEYVDEDFKELTLSFAIRSPECEYVYPAKEGLVSCIANPVFKLKSTKGTFSRRTGYVGTPNYPGVWMEIPLEFPNNSDLTECTFKWPFAVEDNTTYDVYFKEVLNSDVTLNGSMKNISPSKVTRWTADLINKTLVNAAGYRLLEKYSYRKLLANLLQWKGTKIDYSVVDNESQLAILIDLFGTSGYTEIKNAINNYGIDSPQAWNAFMKALL